MEPKNEATLTTVPAFHAVGLKWEGTFEEAGAGGIRAIQKQMQERIREIPHVLHPEHLLGLSYHVTPGGFTHYAVVEVEKVENLPAGMVEVSVPSLTYATCEHRADPNIERSYTNLYAWIEQQGRKEHAGDLTHFEKYPMQQDPYTNEPEFLILIPIE